MKKAFVILFAVIAICGALYFIHGKTQQQSKDTIVVGVDQESFPPMIFVNEKQEVTGFDADLAKEVGKRLNMTVVFKPINWAEKIKLLEKGKIDRVCSGLEITHERKKSIMYGKPYMRTRHLVFVPTESNVTDLSELKGWQIGIQEGTSTDEITASDSMFRNGMRVKKFSSYEKAMDDMFNGGVVGVLAPEVVGRYYMLNHRGKCVPLEKQYGAASYFAIGFRKDNSELYDKVEKALGEIMADGTAAKISEKWLGKDLTIKNN